MFLIFQFLEVGAPGPTGQNVIPNVVVVFKNVHVLAIIPLQLTMVLLVKAHQSRKNLAHNFVRLLMGHGIPGLPGHHVALIVFNSDEEIVIILNHQMVVVTA